MPELADQKISLVKKALSAPYATFYWFTPEGKLMEAYVNAEDSGKYTPSADGNSLTGHHNFVQIESEDIILEKHGSYTERHGSLPPLRVGDGTKAHLELQEDAIVLMKIKEIGGVTLPSTQLCTLRQLVGLSILEKYGEQHKNYRF